MLEDLVGDRSARGALNTIPASIARPMTDREQRQHRRPSTRIA